MRKTIRKPKEEVKQRLIKKIQRQKEKIQKIKGEAQQECQKLCRKFGYFPRDERVKRWIDELDKIGYGQ